MSSTIQVAFVLAGFFTLQASIGQAAGTSTSTPAPAKSAVAEQAPAPAPAAAKAPTPLGVQIGEAWKLVVEAQYRPRFIGETGRDFVEGPKKAFLNHRARVGLSVVNENGLGVTARVQDVRTWGEEEPNALNDFDADGLDMHEAFATIPIVEGVRLQLGRQEIVWDNHRLLGNVDWVQRAQSFDAIRLYCDVKDAGIASEIFAAKVKEANNEPDGHTPKDRKLDIDLGGAHVTYELMPKNKLSAVYLFNGDYGKRNERHTVGVNAFGALSDFSYSVEGYFQGGKQAGNAVKAYFLGVGAGYTLSTVPTTPGILGWFELVSGDGTPPGAFDTMYATNHKFYGEMDLFLNLPLHTMNLGLMDIGGRLSAAPASFLKLNLDYHHFRSPKASAAGKKAFGDEIDAKLVITPLGFVNVQFLYGVFIPNDIMRERFKIDAMKSLETEHFVYLTTEVKM